MDKKKIKRLCKISEITGYFVIVGGLFGLLFDKKEWEEIIIKVSTLVFFFGVAFLIPQDVFDKKERDELGDFSFQSIVPSAKLCAALLLTLHMVVITWIHYWNGY